MELDQIETEDNIIEEDENTLEYERLERIKVDPNLKMALIIDDDAGVQTHLKLYLNKNKFETWICDTSKKAINICQKFYDLGIEVNVIFLDINLNDSTNGVDFLRLMRIKRYNPNAFVLVMTGSDDIKTINICKILGCDDFQDKPISKTVLNKLMVQIENKIKSRNQICPYKQYYVEKKLGEGGQGSVYLVIHKGTGKKLAMKIVKYPNGQKIKEKPDEVFYLQNLNCPTIIGLEEYLIENDKSELYMFMEYAEGGTLESEIKLKKSQNKRFSYEEILNWMVQIYLGLYILHDKSIIHRDIKGQNIFLTKDKNIKIGDLGAAKQEDKAKTVIKVQNYNAPEMENDNYTYKIDIFSSGILLFELIFLENPFQMEEIITSSENKYTAILKLIDKMNQQQKVHPNLRRLMQLTLSTDPAKRASTKDLLSLRFVNKAAREILEKISDDNLLHDKILQFQKLDNDHIFSFEKLKESEKVNYYELYKNVIKIKLNHDQLLYKNIFSLEKETVVWDNNIKDDKKNSMIKILQKYKIAQYAFTKYSKKYYKLNFNLKDDVDNSICFEIPQDKLIYMSKNSIQFTADLLNLIYDIIDNIYQTYSNKWHQVQEYLLEEKVYSFLLQIKCLQNLKLSSMNKYPLKKYTLLLNIYQIMYYHYIMKLFFGSVLNYDKYSFTKFLYLFFIKNIKKIDVVYEIDGYKYSIFTLKELIIKGNCSNKLSLKQVITSLNNKNEIKSSNYDYQSITYIDLLQLKLRTLCLDPPTDFSNGTNIYIPTLTKFIIAENISISNRILKDSPEFTCQKEKVLNSLDVHFLAFLKEKIILDYDALLIPSLFKQYLKDFGMTEKEMQIYLLERLYKLDNYNEKIKLIMVLVEQDVIKVKYTELNHI